MERYKILLVDDEEEIREGIVRKIPWNEYGFEIIGSVGNGNDALEIAEEKQPDVVMTDVMMPFMDGLELGEKLVQIIPSVKLIIFSGADDFNYVKKALKIQAVEYVLKPIDATEIGETLQRLRKKLDAEYEEKRNLETLRQHYMDSLPVLREHFLIGLADGRVSHEQIERNKGIGQIDPDAWGYTVGLLDLDPYQQNKIQEFFHNHDEALVPTTILQLTEESLREDINVSSFYYGDMIGMIAHLSKEEDIYQFIKLVNQLCKKLNKIYGLEVTGGIGTICHSLMELRYARKEAQTALSYRISLGSGQAIYLGDVEPEKNSVLQFLGGHERGLVEAIKLGNVDEIQNQVTQIFEELQSHMLTKRQLEVYFIEVQVSFLKLIEYYDLNTEELFETKQVFQDIDTVSSMEDGKHWMLSKSLELSLLIKKSRSNTRFEITTRAKSYVEENYFDENLSVEVVSRQLHISPSYFSTLFKKEAGISFVAYLTEVRMKKAVELLETTNEKSYIIAEKVGYTDPNYFSYVFKKHHGVSPQRYRKRK